MNAPLAEMSPGSGVHLQECADDDRTPRPSPVRDGGSMAALTCLLVAQFKASTVHLLSPTRH